MSVNVRIPTQLRSLTGGDREVSAEGSTVGAVIADLEQRFPGLGERLVNDGELRRFVNLYVDGEDVRFQEGLATAVPGGSEVAIIPAVAGG